MKSMKKLVLVGLVLLASVVVLVGCDTNVGPSSTSGTGNNTGGGTTVTPVTVTVTQENFDEGLAEVMQKSKSILILTEDISVAETMKITSGDFILDLNGHKIEGTEYPVLEIAEAVSLVIQDSGENGCITPTRTASGMPLGVCNKGSLTLTSGSIEVNGEDSVGIENQGDFRMTGGRIIVNESSPDFLIQVTGVNNNSGTLWVSGGTIAVTGSGGTRGGCDGIWCGTLYLSGNPSITGTSNISSTDKSDSSFILVKPITLVGKLSNTYTVKLSELDVGDAVVIGGEGYLLSENDVNNFELLNKNMELVLDKNQNALVLKETSTN